MRSFDNTFGRPAADRRTIERSDDAWINAQRARAETRFLPVVDNELLVRDARLARLRADELPPGWQERQQVFVGLHEKAPLFAIDLTATQAAGCSRHGERTALRAAALRLPHADAALAAHALAVLHWHRLNAFCGGCGKPLESSAGGHSRHCTNDACDAREIFPRIDPAVIVLVTFEDRCLLGRQASWPAGRYSCLAGFAEAGETLEEVVRREVFEEAGVCVGEVTYHSSQPWPFPQSLMLGFRAEALSPDITLHDDELEDARWFTREEIRKSILDGSMKASSRLSIAWRLLRDWYAEGADPAELERVTE